MRRVLFIAYLFPPIANSGTRRSLSFANHLPDQGWEPMVLTRADPPANACDPALLAEVRAGTHVERAPLASDVIARGLSRGFSNPGLRRRVEEGLSWRLAHLAQVPDDAASWFPTAVRRGVALHKQVGYDVVYASGWPWTSFLTARAIGVRTGCPYVLDYRDLWKPTGTHAWEGQTRAQAWFNPRLERWAARRAAAMITIPPSLVDVIRGNAGVEHVHCITNGFEPADFPVKLAPTVPVNDRVRISYTGVWRPGYGLEDLYRAVRLLMERRSPHLKRLLVDAAGFRPGPARQFGVEDVIVEHGAVPHQVALDLMNAADALYLPVPLGYYAKASLPGKLFEYLGSGRPILAVVPADSEVARVAGDVEGTLRIEPGDVPALAGAIESLCSGAEAGLFAPRRPEQLAAYTRAATTRALAGVFDQALHQGVGTAR